MKNLLVSRNDDVLVRFVARAPLLAFDFDGTLAPLVADRDRAWLPASTRRLLRPLAERFPCVVISGRGYVDITRRVRGIAWKAVVGNHGAESHPPLVDLGRYRRLVRDWRAELDEAFAGRPEIDIEDKSFSLSVHYRDAHNRPGTRRLIEAAASALPSVRIIDGKLVVNLVPTGLPHKGRALGILQKRFGCARALYVGDDVTDEDVFVSGRRGRLLGVRVGRSRRSAAEYYLPKQTDIDELLRRLLAIADIRP